MNLPRFTNLVLLRSVLPCCMIRPVYPCFLAVIPSIGQDVRKNHCRPTKTASRPLPFPDRRPQRGRPSLGVAARHWARPLLDLRSRNRRPHQCGNGRRTRPALRLLPPSPIRVIALGNQKCKQFERFGGSPPDRGRGIRHRHSAWVEPAIGHWPGSSESRRNPHWDTPLPDGEESARDLQPAEVRLPFIIASPSTPPN